MATRTPPRRSRPMARPPATPPPPPGRARPARGANGAAADHPTLHAGTVEILLGEGAQLTFVELQNWGEHVWNFTHERARVGRAGVFNWIFGPGGSRLPKNFSELSLGGGGAEGGVSGLYFADGHQR